MGGSRKRGWGGSSPEAAPLGPRPPWTVASPGARLGVTQDLRLRTAFESLLGRACASGLGCAAGAPRSWEGGRSGSLT